MKIYLHCTKGLGSGMYYSQAHGQVRTNGSGVRGKGTELGSHFIESIEKEALSDHFVLDLAKAVIIPDSF